MIQDLFQSRELAWRLFIRNISAKYRQTFIGYLWAVLPPLLTSGIWIFLNSQNILKFKDTDVPYPLYVLVGTILWQVFVNSIHTPIRVVKDSSSMIAKINFPREALILAAFLEVGFHFLIQMCLLAIVFICFGFTPSVYSSLALLGILTLILTGMVAGILLTPIAVLYEDVQQGLPMVLQPLFYLTPIVYNASETGFGAVLAMLNPVSPLIRFSRELIITGDIVCLSATLTVSAGAFILLFFGWLLYRVSIPHLVERISS